MIVLVLGVLVLVVATAVVVRAILRGRRDARAAELAAARLERLAYHTRRSREIGAALTALGDDAQHVFPPARNGS